MRLAIQGAAILRIYWREERSHFQNIAFSAMVLPVAVSYLGVMLFAQPTQQRAWIAGALTLGVALTSSSQVGFAILWDRFAGRLALLRSTPLSRAPYYLAHLLLASAESAIVLVAACAICAVLGMGRPGPGSLLAAAGVGALGGSSVAGLSAIVALRAQDPSAGASGVSLASLGLAIVSPVFYALEDLPPVLQPVACLSPLTHLAPLVRSILAGDDLPAGPLVAALALAFIVNTASIRVLRW